MAQIIDGKQISAQIKEELREEAAAYKARGIEAALAVIQVGEDPASSIYVRNKKKACAYVGVRSESYELPRETTQEALLALIENLDEVRWAYPQEDENGEPVQITVYFDAAAARLASLDQPVKTYGSSPQALEELLSAWGLSVPAAG